MPLEAVLAGLHEGQRAFGIETRVIVDHSRRKVERGPRTLSLALEYGVAGIGMAGDESFGLAPYKDLFDQASEAGLHLVHHAGETAGPDSIREALGTGRAERIGHGIHVLDDPSLVAELRARQLPLEVCPSSNVALGPITLTEELTRARDTFGLDDPTLATFNHTAINASFAPPETKTRLHTATSKWLDPERA